MRSSRMRLPAGGALGRISCAAGSFRVAINAPPVAAKMAKKIMPTDRKLIISGLVYCMVGR